MGILQILLLELPVQEGDLGDVLLDLGRQFLDCDVEPNDALVVGEVCGAFLEIFVLFLEVQDVGFGVLEFSLLLLELLVKDFYLVLEFFELGLQISDCFLVSGNVDTRLAVFRFF